MRRRWAGGACLVLIASSVASDPVPAAVRRQAEA